MLVYGSVLVIQDLFRLVPDTSSTIELLKIRKTGQVSKATLLEIRPLISGPKGVLKFDH